MYLTQIEPESQDGVLVKTPVGVKDFLGPVVIHQCDFEEDCLLGRM